MSFMNILDRFSEHLREVLAKAMQLASALRHRQLEPIHLFRCLADEKGAMAAEIISRFKIELKTIDRLILELPAENTEAGANRNSVAQNQIPPLSEASKIALEKAMLLAQQSGGNFLGSEHLLAAILELNDRDVGRLLEISGVRPKEIIEQATASIDSAAQFPRLGDAEAAAEKIQDNILGRMAGELAPMQPPRRKKTGKKETALEYFANELTAQENLKNLDPVIGREKEIERLTQILCRRTKNNPVLLGDPGVGKTAIVEGLAKKIAAGEAPAALLNKRIYALDMGLLIAGTIYRGEFEGRLKEVIDEASADPNIVLFIDEMHNIVGAGSNQGTMDAANLLKPALSRGLIRCIGSTTPNEYKKFVEIDAALERRFQPIYVHEPSEEEAKQILSGVKKNYEEYHGVEITEEAVNAAVDLSARHISGKFLPDKAIDILDETAAAKRLQTENPAEEKTLADLRKKLRALPNEKEKAALEGRFGEAIKMKEDEGRLRNEIKKMENIVRQRRPDTIAKVTARDILEQVAKITGAEPSELVTDRKGKFEAIETTLKKQISGQDEALEEIVRFVRQASLGVSNPDRPLLSLLFVGESGVGKTETAKILAKALYPNQDALLKLNMAEFTESHSTAKLLGSPAGYVGYREANQFTDRIKINPHCLVLFDEIDKAHAEVLKLLLDMLESGEITDSVGKKISLKHAIIILTTSFGAEEAQKGAFGFATAAKDGFEPKARLIEKLKERFTPELINRLDNVCLFKPLARADLIKIAELEIAQLNERLKKYETAITVETAVLELLLKQLPEKNANARDIRQRVRWLVEGQISEMIIRDRLKPLYRLTCAKDALRLK